ncbi:hypothetical protein J4217_03545 [Candidatus Pacearchaeota archaeon]|nr:hypothetical protein [uncultured archaeon]MBS3091493.1 hypothetical protein [Candidatus Pacearchaeota archaeon]
MNEDLRKKIEQMVKEVSFLRGVVITKSVDVELMIGAIITNYFALSNKHSDFSTMVLSDPYFSFGLKINILKKILNKINWSSYDGFKEDLQRIDTLRNRFAHAHMFGFEGDLAYPAGEKPLKVKKAKEMYDEFIPIWLKVFEELDNVFWQIIDKPKPVKKFG